MSGGASTTRKGEGKKRTVLELVRVEEEMELRKRKLEIADDRRANGVVVGFSGWMTTQQGLVATDGTLSQRRISRSESPLIWQNGINQ